MDPNSPNAYGAPGPGYGGPGYQPQYGYNQNQFVQQPQPHYGQPQQYFPPPHQQGPPSYGSYQQPLHPMPVGQHPVAGGDGGMDPLMAGIAGASYLRQAGDYLQGSQQYFKQRMSFLAPVAMHYYFSIDQPYLAQKLLLLLTPFLKKWNFTRQPEQIAGGHKYRPAASDVNAPELYLPSMAMGTYVLLLAIAAFGQDTANFKPEVMYGKASWSMFAWAIHWLVLRLCFSFVLPVLPPFLDTLAYSGYAFYPVCITMLVKLVLRNAPGWLPWVTHAVWAYGSFCTAVFLIRTIKRIQHAETQQQYNYFKYTNFVLLSLLGFQFPYQWWLTY